MKTTFIKTLGFATTLLFASATNAQTTAPKTTTTTTTTSVKTTTIATTGPTAQQTAKAEKVTGQLKDMLKLSADQEKKVKAAVLESKVKEDQLRSDAKGDKKKLDEIQKTSDANLKARLKTILTPAQFDTMQKAEENSKKAPATK